EVSEISLKKTVSRVSELSGIPEPLVNLDGQENRDHLLLSDIIRELYTAWGLTVPKELDSLLSEYTENLQNGINSADMTVKKLSSLGENKPGQNQQQSLYRALGGCFNYDDHRFLTLEIEK